MALQIGPSMLILNEVHQRCWLGFYSNRSAHSAGPGFGTTAFGKGGEDISFCFFMGAKFGISGKNGATKLQGELLTRLGRRVMTVFSFSFMMDDDG